MHPPWITFFFLISLAGTSFGSVEGERDGRDNSSVSRTQRETYDRERRLIPYMTYYIASSLTTRTNPEARSILVPITSPRENVYQIQTLPKIPITAIQTDNSQQIQILPKPLISLQNPSTTTQSGKEETGIFPQIYTIGSQYPEPEVAGPSSRPPLDPQQIQSQAQPLRVIKINPLAIQQKYASPQLIKIIPLITKLPAGDNPPKSYTITPHRYSYSRTKTQPPSPQSYTLYDQYDQNDHKPLLSQPNHNPFQKNKFYSLNQYPSDSDPLTLTDPSTASDKNKYTLAKIILTTSTPAPHTNIKYTLTNAASHPFPHPDSPTRDQFPSSTPLPGEYNRGHVGTITIPSEQHQVHVNHDPQDLVQLPKLRVPLEEKIRFVATVTPVPVTNDLESPQWKIPQQPLKDNNYDKQTLQTISALLKETNNLPQNLTPQNIDEGIKTLALILERLQQQQQKGYRAPDIPKPFNSSIAKPSSAYNDHEYQNPKKVHTFPEKSGTSTPGRPGIDYPVYSSIPQTNFDCSTQRYKGFFGDPDTKCQVWHYCDLNGGQASFLCPNGTIFSQVALTCDWWFNVKCASTSQLYVLNERLYKYILPFSPSFPEDFSGPVVDTYLEAKFREMEAKLRKKGGKQSTNSTTTETPELTTEASTEDTTEPTNEYQTLSAEVS